MASRYEDIHIDQQTDKKGFMNNWTNGLYDTAYDQLADTQYENQRVEAKVFNSLVQIVTKTQEIYLNIDETEEDTTYRGIDTPIQLGVVPANPVVGQIYFKIE
jgi:hypothetical protein